MNGPYTPLRGPAISSAAALRLRVVHLASARGGMRFHGVLGGRKRCEEQGGGEGECNGEAAARETTSGPAIWPTAKAVVIAAISGRAPAPAMRRASWMPAIVMTMRFRRQQGGNR
jgi:hypothetical protein